MALARRKTKTKPKILKKCNYCHAEKSADDFYISYNPVHSADGKLPICKDCIINSSLADSGAIDEIEFNKILKLVDRPYYKDTIEVAISGFKNENPYIPEEDVVFYGRELIQRYFRLIAMKHDRLKTYDDSVEENFIHKTRNISEKKRDMIAKKYADIQKAKEEENAMPVEEVEWTEQDIKTIQYAVEVVGYDPFEDYPDENRRFLFNSLSPYLEDEDNAEDTFKLSQIIQIVENNNQIRICNKKIANLDLIKNNDDIKALQAIKKGLVESNDRIAKENEISVKNRSNKDAGKSTLTYLMRDLREKNFEMAETDYYDQLRGEGTQWAATVSQKAMLDHCIFDENDKKEIYENQLSLIKELYKEVDDKKEEIRQLLIKVDSLNAEIERLKTDGV